MTHPGWALGAAFLLSVAFAGHRLMAAAPAKATRAPPGTTPIAAGRGGTPIYKTIDADGNVTYSDQGGPNAERITLGPTNRYTGQRPSFAVSRPRPPADASGGDGNAAASLYQEVTIVDPIPEAALRDNAGNVTVVATTAPPLRGGHRLRLLMDGRIVDQGRRDGVFRMRGVDRGAHRIGVQVVDGAGRVLGSSEQVQFYLQRASVLQSPNPS